MNTPRIGSPWRCDLRSQPLQAWRRSQLEGIVAALAEPFSGWACAWGLDARPLAVACSAGPADDDGRAEAWRCVGHSPVAAAWLDVGPQTRAALAGELFGLPLLASPLAREILDECLADLLARLAGTLDLTASPRAEPVPVPHASAWSGRVLLTLMENLRLLLDAGAVRVLLQRRGALDAPSAAQAPQAPLATVAGALAPRPFPLHVHLHGCELEIGRLRELQVGDVLRLQHRLDAPASVHAAGGPVLFHGFLVRSRGRKAVELAPLH